MKERSQIPWLMIGASYAILVMMVGAYFNYTIPYDPEPGTAVSFYQAMFWIMLYIPLFVFPVFAKWEITGFGFSVTPTSIVVSLLFSAFCSPLPIEMTNSWFGAMAEAFARTGEELFFRGFVFLLLLKIFENKRRPWLWATGISSILFSLVHTQTFQPAFFTTQGSNLVAFTIIQRLFNVFLIGFGLALLRYWSKSILPGSIVHSFLNGGPFTIPFSILINAALIAWARTRNEQVFSGFHGSPIAAK